MVKKLGNIEDILRSGKDEKPDIGVEGIPGGIVYSGEQSTFLGFHIDKLYCFYSGKKDALQKFSELRSAQEQNQAVSVEGFYSETQDTAFINVISTPISRDKEKYKNNFIS